MKQNLINLSKIVVLALAVGAMVYSFEHRERHQFKTAEKVLGQSAQFKDVSQVRCSVGYHVIDNVLDCEVTRSGQTRVVRYRAPESYNVALLQPQVTRVGEKFVITSVASDARDEPKIQEMLLDIVKL